MEYRIQTDMSIKDYASIIVAVQSYIRDNKKLANEMEHNPDARDAYLDFAAQVQRALDELNYNVKYLPVVNKPK